MNIMFEADKVSELVSEISGVSLIAAIIISIIA